MKLQKSDYFIIIIVKKKKKKYKKRIKEHDKLLQKTKEMAITIDKHIRSISSKRAKSELLRIRMLQHRKECQQRNLALKREKDNIARSYQELKNKMTKFRDEEVKKKK